MRKKALLIIILFFLIAIFVALWYRNSKVKNSEIKINKIEADKKQIGDKEDINKNKKAYKNDIYGISLQYPRNWDILEKGDTIYFFQPEVDYSIENSQVYPISLRFDFENYPGKKTLDEWAKGKSNIQIGEKEIKNTTINGKIAVVAKTYLGIETLILVDEKSNKQLIFSSLNFDDENINIENLSVYNSIIESFDFK